MLFTFYAKASAQILGSGSALEDFSLLFLDNWDLASNLSEKKPLGIGERTWDGNKEIRMLALL